MTFCAPLRQKTNYFPPRIYTLLRHSGCRLLRQVCAMVPGILLVIPGYAVADPIIFSNLGPGGTYDPRAAYGVSGPLSQNEESSAIGQPFVPTADFAFDTVEVALNWVLDTNAGTVSLMSDLAGRPGSVLESFGFTDRPHSSSTNSDLAVGMSLLRPLLRAGIPYWIVATAEGDAFMGWGLNNTGQFGTAIRINDEAWTLRPELASAAFRVRGSPVEGVVPEPTSLLFLATGAVGVVARRTRQPGRRPKP